MPTMIAVPLIVYKDHAKVGRRRHGVGKVATIHIRMPTRLEHQRTADFVGVRFQPRTTLYDRVTLRARQTARYDAKRFAARMHFNGRYGSVNFHTLARQTSKITLR